MILLREITSARMVQEGVLREVNRGGRGYDRINVPLEAVMNYLGKYHGFNTVEQQGAICNGWIGGDKDGIKYGEFKRRVRKAVKGEELG